MNHAERFTDRDVRESGELREFAVRYAQVYSGEWQVMLDMQQYAVRYGELPVHMARTVLNVARQDARYADQIPAPVPPLRLIEGGTSRRRSRAQQSGRRIDWVQDPETGEKLYQRPYRARISPKHRVKKQWGMSTSKRAHTLHRVGTSELTYFPMVNEWGFFIRWLCGALPSEFILYDKPIDAMARADKECRQCNIRYAELQEAQHDRSRNSDSC